MKKVFITGSSGFVGKNILNYFNNKLAFSSYVKDEKIIINEDYVFHFAGKAHDLNYDSNVKQYYQVNTELTKKVYNAFLVSNAKVFIFLSSVKSIADDVEEVLNENALPNPITHYGKSKLLAEHYINSNTIPDGKRVFILRPCMIHGPGNKGNLNLLYNIVSKGLPWPLGSFDNKRSFCSIENLCFLINEIIERVDIPSGTYNVSDDVPLSTNDIIKLISKICGKNILILKIKKKYIRFFFRICDFFDLNLNTNKLNKLTENYIVDNSKIKTVLNKPFPVNSLDGITKTILYFSNHK